MCWIYFPKLGAKPYSSPTTPNLHHIREGKLFGDLKRYKRLGKVIDNFVKELISTYSKKF